MTKNNLTKRWPQPLSRAHFVAIMGLLISAMGLYILPNFSKFTDTEIFGTFLGGLLCGQGYVLALVSLSNKRAFLSVRAISIHPTTVNKETTYV